MRNRIREASEVDYSTVRRSNSTWPDHEARTLVTAGLLAWLQPDSVLDPACGDGSIVRTADRLRSIERVEFVDLSGPSLNQIPLRGDNWHTTVSDGGSYLDRTTDRFDAIVLTEFLEHVPDPDWILQAARKVGRYLVASSPLIENPGTDPNPEHLWEFDNEGYHSMIEGAGWQPFTRENLFFRDYLYTYQIWLAR